MRKSSKRDKKLTKKVKKQKKSVSKPKEPKKIVGECHYCHDITFDAVVARDPYLVWLEDYPGEYEDVVDLTWCNQCYEDRKEEVS